jgi:hypothetical protein
METENPLVTRINELNREILAMERERDDIATRPRPETRKAFDAMESLLVRIDREIAKRQAEAARIRKDVAAEVAARAAKRAADALPPPPKAAAEVPKLRKQIADAEAVLAGLPEQRRPHVVAAARGDKKAIAALDQIAAVEHAATDKIEIAKAAIAEIETQTAEERRGFAERDADSRFAAAQRVAEEIAAHDHSTDMMMRALAEHLAQRPALLRALRKTGCGFDAPRMNTLSTVEILHRAAKAAGLAQLLSISVRDAVPLEDASRTLLKLAIRRPAPNSAAA